MKNAITAELLQDMIRHWLSTPPNGYLGSGYGSDPLSLLQIAMATNEGDVFLAKMRTDLPLLSALPAGAVNLYFEDTGIDSKNLIIEVAGAAITVDALGNIR